MDLRVLHIDTEPTWRGGENQLGLLIAELSRRGVTSILVGKKGSALEEKVQKLEAKEAFFLPLRGEFDILSARKVARIVDQRAIPIIHSHTSHAHTLAFLVKLLSHKRPKVLVTRRVDFDIYKKGTFKPFTFLKYRYMADHFIAISERIRDVLLQSGVPEEKISLVYSGVDPQRVKGGDGSSLKQRYKVEKGETVLGNISYFADHKAHEDAIAALRIVRERGYKARLFLAGHGEREPHLRNLVRAQGLDDVVTFLGYWEEIRDLLAFFDLFVVSSRQEGLSTSIIDAFFAGCPVVATDAGGIPELVKDGLTGLLRRKGDPSSLAEGIIYAIENPTAMKEMAERARSLAEEHFTAKRMAEGNLEVYLRLLGR